MKKTKLISIFLSALICLASFAPISAFGNTASEFAGTRALLCAIDRSDLDNFIDGGRSAFDITLRRYRPEWLKYSVSTEDREVKLNVEFSFNSYSEYVDRLGELLAYEPSIIHNSDNVLTHIENFSSLELLNFIEKRLQFSNSISELSKEQIFKIEKSTFTLNGNSYDTTDRINLRGSDNEIVAADSIQIITSCDSAGVYKRKIIVGLNSSESIDADSEIVQKQFRKTGRKPVVNTKGNTTEIEVEFEAANTNLLIQKTMLALNAPSGIFEQEEYLENDAFKVKYTEIFDTQDILKEEGSFKYEFTLPEYFKNAASEIENEISLSQDEAVTYSCTKPEASFYYERGLKFSSIEVATDLSDIFGRIKRKISLTAPIEAASYFHDRIKESLEKKMVNGTTLNITDSGANRIYEIAYQAWSAGEIRRITDAITDKTSTVEYNRKGLPFVRSFVSEAIDLRNIVPDSAPCNSIKIKYIFPANSDIDTESIEKDVLINGSELTSNVGNKINVQLEYSYINVIHTSIIIICILAVLLLAALLSIKLRKKISARRKAKHDPALETNTEPAGDKQESSAEIAEKPKYICPNCHKIYDEEVNFCEDCGTKVIKKSN